MKRLINIVLTLLVIFLITGCSVEYNLNINEDSSINEEVLAYENTHKLESRTKLKGEQATNYLFNMFKKNNLDINFTSYEKNLETYGKATVIYKDIKEYANNFSLDLYNKVEVISDNDLITILANQSVPLSKNNSNSLLYDNLEINIYIPFVVIDHNADKVSKNKYTWVVKNDGKLKNIKISYSDKKIPNRANIKINDKNYAFKYEYIIVLFIIFIIIFIIVYVLKNNKKNNVV